MELWRRLIFLVFILAAIWFAKVASLSPLILVEYVDFTKQQKKEGTYMGIRIMTEDKRKLSSMPLREYIAEATSGRLYKVEGKAWEELFTNVMAIREDKQVGKEWSKRLPSDRYPMKVFYFRYDEPPINTFTQYFKDNNDSIYLSLASGQNAQYIKLQYRAYSNGDFHFGSGFSRYPIPPKYLLYPYRHYSLWIAVLGLLFYIFLPHPKAQPEVIQYPLWRMILGDIVAMLLIILFFSFPMFIIGGSTQVFTVGWPLLIFFWPIFFLGIWVLFISAWFAGFSLLIMPDRLKISTYKGKREFFYKDMEFFQPCIFKPPRWLIILSWVAALSGRGSSQIGATGRALILSSSESGSLGIHLKDGSDFFITITDQMGSTIFKGFKSVVAALRKAGVREKEETRVIRSLGLETARLPKKAHSKTMP